MLFLVRTSLFLVRPMLLIVRTIPLLVRTIPLLVRTIPLLVRTMPLLDRKNRFGAAAPCGFVRRAVVGAPGTVAAGGFYHARPRRRRIRTIRGKSARARAD